MPYGLQLCELVPVSCANCLKISNAVGPISRKTSMIPLSDIQRTSVRGTALCLAVSAADPDGTCFEGSQGKTEYLSLANFCLMKEQRWKPTKFTNTYLVGINNIHYMFFIYPSKILYFACCLCKIE